MKIKSLSVENYKSLRQVFWTPGDVSVIVGANASGKSNLADFYDFISNLYRHGLEVAIARKGGYENIAYRKVRRSRGSIVIKITAEFSRAHDFHGYYSYFDGMPTLRLHHEFSLKAEGRAIRADFRIERESFRIERKFRDEWRNVAEIVREGDAIHHNTKQIKGTKNKAILRLYRQFGIIRDMPMLLESKEIPSTELLVASYGRFVPIMRILVERLGSIRVFQLSPTNSREFGVPIPNPEMDMHGGNLPAVVDMIMKRHPVAWSQILQIMCQLLPRLEKIDIGFTHSRTLGLFFHEAGVGRPWNVAEISDGTIHCLALLTALYDPRSALLFLEEPENSVHTWILRNLMDAAKEAAEQKQIIFTTHSREVVDSVDPNDVWVMWRTSEGSNLANLSQLDRSVLTLLETGDLTTFEALDTGVIEQALPPRSEGS